MTPPLIKLLVIEDNPGDADLVDERLREAKGHRFEIVHESHLAGGLQRLANEDIDVVLLDLGLPDSSGIASLERLRQANATVPIVVLTGLNDNETGVAAVSKGAQDYLIKNEVTSELLYRAICYARERHFATQLLHASEELNRVLAAIVENSDDAIIGESLDYIVTSWNKGATQLYGYSSEEINGKSAYVIIPVERRAEAKQLMAMIADGQHLRYIETTRLCKEGRVVDVSISLSPVRDSTGKVIGASSIARDITERKRAVEALLASQMALKSAKEAAELANQAKSSFLANMSHEIRTPMNGVLGMTDLVLDTPLTDEQRDLLGMVKQSGEALLNIINDILDFSKVEAGKFELNRTAFRLREMLAETLAPLILRANQKGIALTSKVADEVPDRLVADAGRLGQVLINLVGNAIKFTEKGKIEIAVELQHLEDDIAGLHFTVSDTGTGIAPDALARLFKPFSQGDNSLTRRHDGTGLGLVISQRLVNMMGGNIGVESGLGQGSTFYFTVQFPIAKESTSLTDKPAETPVKADQPPSRSLHVLVAEDQPVNQMLVERILNKRGHTPVLVGNGQEALDRHAAERFDAILMDIQMPVMDGLTATVAIRERERATGLHIPIIALTAFAQQSDADRCLAAGCDAYLSKPVHKIDLYEQLERLTVIPKGA